MTKILEKAIEEARKLAPEDQDALGSIILEEIADEVHWAKKFAEKRAVLDAIVTQADADIDAGEVSPLELPRHR